MKRPFRRRKPFFGPWSKRMEKKETLTADEGYFFGLGFFETIAVKKGRPLLLDWHLERLVERWHEAVDWAII